MRIQIKLYILVLISITFYSYKSINNAEIIKGHLVSEDYMYNPNGFIQSPFGRINIKTHSFYKNKRLQIVLENRSEGFLEYTIEDLRNDTLLLNQYKIDTLFNDTKQFETYTKQIRNDTVFYKSKKDEILAMIESK
ncbi:hypothetical protein [Aquimarina aggregata]|uniref:hypothetical protein n=1 Tax=Aquimarina aggregata TaxID=1642818 RepID=UPI00248F7140|nr:hypothetical protein [Aquimarina aggregata]